MQGSVDWHRAELTFLSRSTLQLTFSAQFDQRQRRPENGTSDGDGVAIDDISMMDGPCSGGGLTVCYSIHQIPVNQSVDVFEQVLSAAKMYIFTYV